MMQMLARLALAAALAVSCVAAAEPAARFLAPALAAAETITLAPLDLKSAAASVDDSGRLRIGTVRALAKSAALASWTPQEGGFVTRVDLTSPGALGIRVKLELGDDAGAMELRAQGSAGEIEVMPLDRALGPEAWTPWTEGETQSIEIFSRAAPAEGAVRVSEVVHFTDSPFAKAAASSCTLSTACTSGDATLDAAIAERKKSVFRIVFNDGGSSFVCTATLVDTPRRPTPFVMTANHCINATASAASLTGFWFYEASACGSTITSASAVQVAGGSQLVFTNYNADATLLQLNTAPPTGALFAPLNAAAIADGSSFVSLSHPHGDTIRWGTGTVVGESRDASRPYDMYRVTFARGLVEPGSSGSGLFTMNNGHLELRGVLSQAATELSCTNSALPAFYPRLEVFYPQIAQYIGAATVGADDAPNRPQDFTVATGATDAAPLNAATATLAIDGKRLEYAGDVDLFRFFTTQTSYVSAWTEGALDTVGSILDGNGVVVNSAEGAADAPAASDDADWSASGNNNMGITVKLAPGTYYVHVANWVPTGTGAYNLRLRSDVVDANYTDLWSNAAESGWGLSINHQGNTLFATLYTYDAAGNPLWLVMSQGDRQSDGAYAGTLYKTTGSPFAAAWGGSTSTPVGTMRIAFAGSGAGTLQYTFNGTTVTKQVTRFAFRSAPTCTWTAFDRAQASNYQDVWFDPNEPGWGMSIAHQSSTLFAAVFVYGPDGQPTWFVMSEGSRTVSGSWTGVLFKSKGPAFDASPWTAATLTQVGTVGMNFANGNAMALTYTVNGTTVTKQLQRNVFAPLKTECAS